MDLKQLGQIFRTERKRQGLTLVDVSEKSKLSKNTISRFERGIGNCSTTTIVKILKVLRCEISLRKK